MKGTPSEKACVRCGEIKPTDDFYKRNTSPDGLAAACKACQRQRRRLLRGMSAEDKAAHYGPKPTKFCRQCQTEKPREDFRKRANGRDGLQSNCRSCADEYARAYYEANRDKAAEFSAARYKANKETRNAQQRAWYEANRERHYANGRRWIAENKERHTEFFRRRRAAISTTTVGTIDLDALWTGLCGICGGPMDRDVAHPDSMSKSVDHIVPLAKGGTHDQANLQWAHLVCNKRKGARLPNSV